MSGFERPGIDRNSVERFGAEVWEALGRLRADHSPSSSRPGAAERDVRAAVLEVLGGGPATGHEVLREIEERSGGDWTPTAGAVYPTLQLLVDEGLAAGEQTDGRRTYSLTDAGRAAVAASSGSSVFAPAAGGDDHGHADPVDGTGRGWGDGVAGGIPKAGMRLAEAAAQVARTGDAAQTAEAVAVLDEARRRLYALLARD